MPNHIFINKKISPYNKTIQVSSDKSLSIRTILLASQAVGISKVSNILESEDVLNALKTIKKLGINYKKKSGNYFIEGFGLNSFSSRKRITINAGNSGTLARLILGLLVKSKCQIKLIGDKSLSKRDFSRVIKPLRLFGVNIHSRKNSLPSEILGTDYLRPISYNEKIGSAQVKSCIIFCALNTPGKTRIKAKKSRNHTEQLLKSLNYPIKIKKKKLKCLKILLVENFLTLECQLLTFVTLSVVIVCLMVIKLTKVIIENFYILMKLNVLQNAFIN